jgi:hypothetical protein
MVMTRPIRPHKGGRTARAPEARIRPATLANIIAEKQARKISWANMIEEQWGDPLEQQHTGDEGMDAETALETLKGKIELDKTEAAAILADAIDSGVGSSEKQNIVDSLLNWQAGPSDTVASLRSEFKAWYKKYGTYATSE